MAVPPSTVLSDAGVHPQTESRHGENPDEAGKTLAGICRTAFITEHCGRTPAVVPSYAETQR